MKYNNTTPQDFKSTLAREKEEQRKNRRSFSQNAGLEG
jgi:hypothetical protein